jgi:hypothetical protein
MNKSLFTIYINTYIYRCVFSLNIFPQNPTLSLYMRVDFFFFKTFAAQNEFNLVFFLKLPRVFAID